MKATTEVFERKCGVHLSSSAIDFRLKGGLERGAQREVFNIISYEAAAAGFAES